MFTLVQRSRFSIPILSHLVLLVALISSLLITTPAHAQKSQSLDEVRALAVWSQEYSAIMDDVVNLFDIEGLNQILEYTDLIGTEDEELFTQAVKAWSENLDQKIALLEAKVSRLSDPPRITFSRKLNKANKDYKKHTETVVNKSIESALHLKTAFGRIAKGDDSGVNEILLAQQDAAGIAIEAEIVMIKSALVAIRTSNPNYQFQQLILADGKYALSGIQLTKLSILDISTLETRKPFILEMSQQVEISKSMIASGHAAIETTNNTLMREIKRRPEVRKINQEVIDIVNTFAESFRIEAAINKTKIDAIEHYNLDKPIEDIDLLIEQTDARYMKLIEKRFTLFNQRLAMIANMGK
jgi:hypothetical protein